MTKCGSDCTTLLSDPAPRSTITDASGQYSFSQLGNPYVFVPGKWQLSVTVDPVGLVTPIRGGGCGRAGPCGGGEGRGAEAAALQDL